MSAHADIFQWIAGGMASVLILVCSFILSRFTKLEEKLGLISERTARTEVEVERMSESLDRIIHGHTRREI